MPVQTFDYMQITDSIKMLTGSPDGHNTAERLEQSEGFMACYIAFPEMMAEWEMSSERHDSGDSTPVNQVRTPPVIIDEDLMVRNTDESVFFKHVYHALETAVVDAGLPSDAVHTVAVHNEDAWNKEWVDHWQLNWNARPLVELD